LPTRTERLPARLCYSGGRWGGFSFILCQKAKSKRIQQLGKYSQNFGFRTQAALPISSVGE
tara:strand:+ start:7112 stop:7294 length:183 start_codon:yes stop_codon:yes gene_type:complete